MTDAVLASVLLLALSAHALAQSRTPDMLGNALLRCPAARVAFADLAALKEPARSAGEAVGVANSCSYIEKLRSEADVYLRALQNCVAHGLNDLNSELVRVQSVMSKLPDTPQLCRRLGG